MRKGTAWMFIFIAFVIGLATGYTWHYNQKQEYVTKVCNMDKEGNETCIYYNKERIEK